MRSMTVKEYVVSKKFVSIYQCTYHQFIADYNNVKYSFNLHITLNPDISRGSPLKCKISQAKEAFTFLLGQY